MDTPRKAKIRELKSNIDKAREELTEVLKEYREFASSFFYIADEFDIAYRKLLAKPLNLKINEYQAVIEALNEELKLTRMNKTGSKFFEFKPSPPNRQMRKQYARSLTVQRKNKANH